jgi:XTP/dITP diphosphohydrolase
MIRALEIEILDGLPGVHSARFAGENKDSSAKLSGKYLTMMGDAKNRKARVRTIIALILEDKEYIFEGVAEGKIIKKERGNDGFGYDPVFIPDGQNITFAEMSLDEKNRISHRAIAFEKLKTFLLRYQNNKNRV